MPPSKIVCLVKDCLSSSAIGLITARQGRFSKTSGGVNGDTTENVEMGFTVGCDNWSEWAVAESRGNRTIEWLQMHPHSRTVRRTIPAASQLLGCRQALYRPFMEK